MTRKRCLAPAALWLAAVLLAGPAAGEDLPEVTVYKTPTCGCCGKWADYLQASGFPVKSVVMPDVSGVKAENGLPAALGSCHTAIVDGYVVEGHVPADIIKRLLRERPDVAGIAVPGMPAGSPGMEVGHTEAYQVLSFDRDGQVEVYATVP